MGIFRGESVPGSGDFWEGSGTPRMAERENSSMAGSGFFQNFHHGEWGGEEGSIALLQKLHSLTSNQYAHLEP